MVNVSVQNIPSSLSLFPIFNFFEEDPLSSEILLFKGDVLITSMHIRHSNAFLK